jgi:subtilisin family serine protease
MASPHVAGAAALCRGTHRLLDMDVIKNLLIKHADNLGSPGRDDEYGHGRVDCYGAAFDKSCG